MNIIINHWHSSLNMPKYDRDWHVKDIEAEFVELKESEGLIARWSELSDIAYTYTRGQWSGHGDLKLPINKISYLIGLLYMFPKYTLRWKFYFKLGKIIDKNLEIREVRNPQKNEKLEKIAKRYYLDKDMFTMEAEKLKKKWIFLK